MQSMFHFLNLFSSRIYSMPPLTAESIDDFFLFSPSLYFVAFNTYVQDMLCVSLKLDHVMFTLPSAKLDKLIAINIITLQCN